MVQSIGMSPDNKEVLAVLDGLNFPGDVMATIDPTTQAITSTVNLETGSDTMGQLVSDPILGYVWVTDETSGGDVIQNLNLAVSDPASQPYVTAVGGTSFGHGSPIWPTSGRTGLERCPVLLGRRGRRGYLGDIPHALIPAAIGHRERQQRHTLCKLER